MKIETKYLPLFKRRFPSSVKKQKTVVGKMNMAKQQSDFHLYNIIIFKMKILAGLFSVELINFQI